MTPREPTDTLDESDEQSRNRLQLPAEDVRVGDSVVFTSKLNKEYRFTVAAVDTEWLTFQTGQMVHVNRFERENFVVIRNESAAITGDTNGRPRTPQSSPKTD